MGVGPDLGIIVLFVAFAMAKLTVLLLLLAVLGWQASAQPDCRTLNVDRSESSTISGERINLVLGQV